MITWMLYTLAIGLLIGTVALFVEQLAWARRWRTRGIWGAAILLMLLAMCVPALPRVVRVAPIANGVMIDGRSERANNMALQNATALPERKSAMGNVINGIVNTRAWIAMQDERLAVWRRAWLAIWFAFSALLALIVLRIARRARAFSRNFPKRDVDGTIVVVTDSIGPAVMGTSSSAILLPEWALNLDGSLLSLVLDHEREHVAARDPLLLAAGLCAVVLVPWHLPLWWGYRRLRLAIEVDCDARVLRLHPDVKKYAQLLLLVSQRSAYTSRVFSPVLSVATPLRAQEAQLSQRICAMTQPVSARSWARTAALAAGALTVAGVAYALPAPRRSMIVPRYSVSAHSALNVRAVTDVQAAHEMHRDVTRASAPSGSTHVMSSASSAIARGGANSASTAFMQDSSDDGSVTSALARQRSRQPRAIVHVTELGVEGVPADSTGEGMLNEILIIASGRARVGIWLGVPVLLTGTLHLKTLPAMTLDVTDGEVKVVLVGEGRISMGGDVTGGAALHLKATSNRITFMQGGMGVKTQ